MKIKVEIELNDLTELNNFLEERDKLRDRIRALEATPLRFSRPDLANKVLNEMHSLTSDQASNLRNLIEEVHV